MSDDTRWFVEGRITRWVSDEIVEYVLTDAFGQRWTFIEKFYDLTPEELSSESQYPQVGYVACKIIARSDGESGLAEVDTEETFRGYESQEGQVRFHVRIDQLKADVLPEPHFVPLIKKTPQ
ncbi:MAG TPA: hypothetical protein VKB71_00290 [Rhizomicrobium sp.]|nr:hypothetical protein [Rhizomicrobium sp.]